MAAIRKAIDVRVEAVRKQLRNVGDLITEPVGVFQTLDKMITTFRTANRDMLQAFGVRLQRGVPLGRGQVEPVKRLKERIEEMRRRRLVR